ncbi:MAG: Ribosomal RNA small subunit methyltransferase I [Candidatus Ordinivivax streblomastigis]|uniref:Ribosomal RNA small subunit methyltransferase I n=1 Tax=Candidatus Ordinivivax streblomastigis TaxID=2540710 RepID=A0A5M8P5Z2_9BACT|nr:MAG: Ribosomal RNA small subunit methyltransferase I [Candidatus Ordinivivax streblomastigis]
MSSLFLIPVTLGETPVEKVLPLYNTHIIHQLKYFIVENIRTARRFLKQAAPEIKIDDCTFFTLNKHTSPNELSGFLQPIAEGWSIGVLSEAGCPAIADPGADVVAIAQQKNIPVVPLVGPSSILLSVMGSGFNGQSFTFHGYLPIDSDQRIKTLKILEQRVYSDSQTQLFIETPYRNNKMVEDILKTCKPSTSLCIAADITLETEFIKTKTVAEWKKNIPELSKRPCIFLLGNNCVY